MTMECGRCGAPNQAGRFCMNCGAPVTPPAEPTVLTGPEHSPSRQDIVGPTASYPVPSPTTPQPVPGGRPARRGRGAIALAVLAVAVLLLAGVGVWFMLRPTGGEGVGTVAGTAASPTDAPTAGGGTGPAPIAPPGSKGESSSSSAATTTVTTVATTTVSQDPMGGPRADITCGSGYIVQVASEIDQPAFTARVAALRAAGTLPSDVRWTETSASCPIFTNQANVIVLYAGPFATVADSCPARLAAPADAFVKAADPNAVGSFHACLCPAGVGPPPPITAVGQQGPWVGELQRVLGAGLDYGVGNINADPSIGDPGRWGTYTVETAAAVGRFQADHGLPASQQVDAATWSALQAAWCGQE
jgi:hypothetical protein